MTDAATTSLDTGAAADTNAAAAAASTGADNAAAGGDAAADANANAGGDTAAADTAAKASDGKAGTIADAAEAGGDEGGEQGGDADWRKELTGGDEKLMKRISRYASPAGIVKALIETQDKLRSSQANVGKLPDDATDEQKAEWRKSQGVPEKADGYQLPKVSGYEWSDGDKEVAGEFFGAAHEANMSQAQAERVFNWYAQRMQDIQAKQYEQDTSARNALEDDLRTEWGPEYRANVKMLARYAEKTPGVGAGILEARLPDGRRLGEVPEFVKDLVERARDHYGDSSFIAGDGGSTMNNRRAEIEKVMAADMNAYRAKGPNGRSMADEYLDILKAEERTASRR